MTRASLLAFACICVLTIESAGASDPTTPQASIETRRKEFKKMGAAMKTIVDQLKTDAPDKARMAEAAAVIDSSAPQVIHWFPAGSGAEADVETDALPYLWKDRAKFDSTADRLVVESKKLTVAMSGADLAAIRTQVKAVGDTCSACHRSFRAD